MNGFVTRLSYSLVFAAGIILTPTASAQNSPASMLKEMLNPRSERRFVIAHRGNWREAPENSIQALRTAEDLGVDAVELDLKRTSDGKLVVMHDQNVDRTTTGKGLVSGLTLASLEALKLRAATGHPTVHSIPTFEEELLAAEGHMVLDIDQAWDYFPAVLQLIRTTGTADQVIVNSKPNMSLDEFEQSQGVVPDDITLMIVLDASRPNVLATIKSFERHKRTIVQLIFAKDEDLLRVVEATSGSPIFVNSLWPELCAGHDDDTAVEQHREGTTWGWLMKHHVTLLQTDRPRELIQYIRAHPIAGAKCETCAGPSTSIPMEPRSLAH